MGISSFLSRLKELFFSSKKRFLGILFGLVILLAIPVTITLVSQQQDIRQRASGTDITSWGKIANPELLGQKVKGIFFFAGPPNPSSTSLYTRHPFNQWSQDNSNVDFLFDQIQQAGANTIKLSWWGPNNENLNFSPTVSTIDVNKTTFEKANARGIMVAPVIEVSDAFKFYSEFPSNTANLEARIKSLLETYGNYPNWLQLYDKNGQPRKVIWLIETIHAGTVSPQEFAQAFDTVANKIEADTGQKIGFIIDPTPLPPNGSYDGPDPAALQNTQSLLAINPFNTTSDGNTETERLAKAEEILKKWKDSGMPLMVNVLPGYDDHIVRPPGQIYGDNPAWRNAVEALAKNYETAGITLDIWNGFTEGYAFVPTTENGQENYNLAKRLFSSITSPTPTPSTPTPTPQPALPTAGINLHVYFDPSFISDPNPLDYNTFKTQIDELKAAAGSQPLLIRFPIWDWEAFPLNNPNNPTIDCQASTPINCNPARLEQYGQAIDYVLSKGFQVELVTNVPQWAKLYSTASGTGEVQLNESQYLALTNAYYRELGTRYGGKVRVWLVMGEADVQAFDKFADNSIKDSPLSATYLAELNAVYNQARTSLLSVDPTAQITTTSGGWPYNSTLRDRWNTYFDSVGHNFDILSVDIYPDNNVPEIQQVSANIAALKSRYGKPVIMAETGLCTSGTAWTAADQAAYIPQTLAQAHNGGAASVLLFEYQDNAAFADPYNCAPTFGIIDKTGVKKSSYSTIMACLLGGSCWSTPTPVPPTPTTTSQCLLKSQGDASCDGKINTDDFNIWRDEYLGTLSTKTSDLNTNGTVTTDDFNIWRDGFLNVSLPH